MAVMATGKVYIQTYGCQMNDYDSDRMADLLAASHNLELTEDPTLADVLLVNTCSIREKAQEKLFHQLGRWKHLKESNPDLVIGVGGCVASQEGKNIAKRAPQVDMIFGPQTLHRLPQLLDQHRARQIRVLDVTFPAIEKFDCLPPPSTNGPVAQVSIMEGCSKYCSFCVVPYTRGAEVSRPLTDILAELQHLAEHGVREVNLLGQNVNAYQGLADGVEDVDLAELIAHVAAISGLDRIRFTTSHPMEFSHTLIDAFAEHRALVSHVHLPVQSGSDGILEQMKRGYDVERYLSIINGLKQARPDIALSSDFIVGFPGETEADFEATMELIRTVNFDTSFSFIYSARPGTPAALLPDKTSMEEKKERLQRLQALLHAQATTHSANMVGTVQSVLVTGASKRQPEQMQGRTENNRVVNFSLKQPLVGQFVDVLIEEALPNSLRGVMMGADALPS